MAFVNALAAPRGTAPSGNRFLAALVGAFALTAALLPFEALARAAPEAVAGVAIVWAARKIGA